MSCEKVLALLNDWLDDELDASQRGQVRGHLDNCVSCAQSERSLRNVKLLVQAKADRGEPSDGLRNRVVDRLTHERAQGPTSLRWTRSPWLRAAAVLLVLASGFVIYSVVISGKLPSIAHATVAEESLARHIGTGVEGPVEPRWPFETIEDAQRVLERELGTATKLPIRSEQLKFKGASPTTYGSARGVRLFCEYKGRPFSIFALESIPDEVRQRSQCCFCRRKDDRYLVACWAARDLYFSMVGTDLTEGEFMAQLMAR